MTIATYPGFVLGIFAAGALSLAAFAQSGENSAVILNSGSTNKSGFKIVVDRAGDAEYTAMPRGHRPLGAKTTPEQTKRKLPEALVRRFYSDLEKARPFSELPKPTCMKSASFGTRLTIRFQDEETPDLKCGSGESKRLGALIEDSKQVVALFETR